MDRFALALSPSGRVRLDAAAPDAALVAPDAAARIERAFERGWAEGVLHLGAAEIRTVLPPSAAWFRELAERLVTALCATPEDAGEAELPPLEPNAELVAELIAGAPPFVGSELLTPEVVRGVWRELEGALRKEVAAESGSVRGWLAKQDAVWHRVGRVVLHLAENKRDRALPFAFLATYTTRVGRGGALEYVPLGRAVEASAGKRDRRALLALLEPLERASKQSELLQTLVASGDVFHPLAWDPRQAYAFLQQIPVLEASGVVVRVPDWWKSRRPPRPKVNVTVGGKKPGGLGAESLVAFDVSVTLDGEALRPEDWALVERGTSGLALVRGRWVEIDRDRLEATLSHWRAAERAAGAGVSFHDAMRLLSGAGAAEDADEGAAWSDVHAGAWLGKTLERLEKPAEARAVEPGTALRATLRPYQKIGLRWLALLDELGLGGCLADDMGLGKTLQVIALLVLKKEHTGRVNALLVVPASLLANWKSELERFAPSLSALFVHPSQPSNAGATPEAAAEHADVVLTTYGMLTRQAWLRERAWSIAVLDEAQAIKNPSANQTRAVKRLHARFRLVLTGTPVENRLGDLWSLFDFACPGLLGSAKEFGALAKRLERSEHADFSPLRRLLRPYVLRRLKTDKSVIADLPDKTEVVAHCSLTKAQAVLYQQAVDELARELAAAEGMKRRGVILATILKLKQICNHPAHWLRHGGWDESESGKLLRVRELCEPIVARQERLLVFTQFREATAPLAAFLRELFGREGLVLHGATSVAKRKALVDAFQRDDGPPFFVLSLKAGGTGLNLTAASHVVHFDRWWNPAVEAQATDRAFRIGQKRNVLVHKLVCRGTVEERIDRMLESKRSLGEAVLAAGAETLLTELPNDEVLRLVALDLASALGDAAA
ncbi:MAG TPA: DEAD/DEAH box helicase [Polyangiaceae bacterium]|nr:DEAD/DEAH box helicase [Polyangiaceae bacterium]